MTTLHEAACDLARALIAYGEARTKDDQEAAAMRIERCEQALVVAYRKAGA